MESEKRESGFETESGAQARRERGRLRIFFGYAHNSGKTYAMLDEAREMKRAGADVLVGFIEAHTNAKTLRLVAGFTVLPPMIVENGGETKQEFDLDAALKRRPSLIVVDGLACRNAPGMRNAMRYQDVEELLNAGIDVYTTLSVTQIESLTDVVQAVTGETAVDTVPDAVLDNADQVTFIDAEPEDLYKRAGDEEKPQSEGLRVLREAAVRRAADRISRFNKRENTMESALTPKILVCVSSSPSALKCVRLAARAAEERHVQWWALYVENTKSRFYSETSKKNINAALEIAQRLGAQCVTLSGEDPAAVTAEYAKLLGVTDVYLGRRAKRRGFPRPLEKSFSDELLNRLRGAQFHIVPETEPREVHRRAFATKLELSWRNVLITLGLLIAATLVSAALRALGVSEQNAMMVYILSILLVSRTTGGYLYGIGASIVSVLAFNFFFTEPYFTFKAIQNDYPVTFFIMLLISFISSAVTVRIKRQARLSAEREWRTNALYEINKRLLVTRGIENIVALTSEYVVKFFGRSVIFYVQQGEAEPHTTVLCAPSEHDANFLEEPTECAAAQWVLNNKKNAGAGTNTFKNAQALYLPLVLQGNAIGVLGLSCRGGRIDQNNLLLLQTLCSQVALALGRQFLSDEQNRILMAAEQEKMRGNLLRAISHDLRTPLTGILGASSALIENGGGLDGETRNKLLINIREDSQWLIRMVENLLSVTRITQGEMNVKKASEAAEEVLASAVSRSRKRFPGRLIRVKAPDELLMVPMDATLIEQVLINLVENALRHSPEDSAVDVEARREGGYAVFEVIDNGEGISAQDFPYLFETYVPNGKRSADANRGMGIGLSICMTIIKAHQGTLSAFNRETGGAVFRFSLPLK